MKLRLRRIKRLSGDALAELLLCAYLCIPFIRFVANAVLSRVGLGSLSLLLALTILYAPLLFLTIRSRKFRSKDFSLLFTFIVLFFFFSFLLHPEYEYWYTRAYYGVWDYVLRPDNGLYIYLFIRLVNDPERILKCVRYSAWPMYLYFGYRLIGALRQGYWVGENSVGESVHMAYNLSFGYDILLFVLAFFYAALEDKKVIDWVGTIIGFVLILTGGSRGPILDVAIFGILYIFLKLKRSKRKGVIIGLLSAVTVLFYYTYETILMGIVYIMNSFNLPSRFFTMLLNGNISDDSGRDVIWAAAIEMIRKNPLGYGAMGARHVIANIHIVGHPHQFFLEFLIDFGVIAGSIIIIYFAYKSIQILSLKGFEAWQGVFIVFFGRACQLLVSLTYWHSIGLWGVVAVGVCIAEARKSRGSRESKDE